MDYKKGDTLKLSEEGLNWIYSYNPKGRVRASQWRFEYRCQTRRDVDCISVLKLPQRYYHSYHNTFLERA